MKKLLYLILVLIGVCSLSVQAKKEPPGPSKADRDKADYLFLEALRARAEGEADAAFSLVQRAAQLNPDDKEIGLELSRYLFALPSIDSLQTPLRLMRAYVDANPADYDAGSRYALISQQLGNSAEALRVLERLHYAHPTRPELTWATAQALAQTEDSARMRRAIALYDSLETTQGPNVQLATQRLGVYFGLGDTAAIIADADRLRAERPTDPDFQVFSGDIYSHFGGSRDTVLAFYDRAIELDPTSGLAYYSKASYYREQGDTAAYEREMANAMTRDNLDVQTKLAFVQEYIKSSMAASDSLTSSTGRIREMFDTLCLQHPLEHDVHSMYTAYLTAEKDWAGAAEQLEQTLGLEPANEQDWDYLSAIYFQLNDTAQAEDAVKRGLHYYPESVDLLLKLGVINTMRKDYLQAEQQYKAALKAADPKDIETLSQIYTSLGDAYQSQEMADSAYAAYDKALAYNPDNSFALNNAAYHMACDRRNLEKALKMAEKACQLSVDNPTNIDTYAWVLYQLGRWEEARTQMDRALELTEDNPDELGAELLDHAGDIYFRLGEQEKAMDFWRKALELEPGSQTIKRKIKDKGLPKAD